MKNICLLVSLLLALTCCQKADAPEAIQSIQLIVIPHINSATLLWENSIVSSDSVTGFSVFINNTLIADQLKLRQFEIKNLTQNTLYNAKIEAYAGSRKVAEKSFQFTTLVDQAPLEFDVIGIEIQSTSVLIEWSKSTDPENSSVLYDVYLNGQLKINGIKYLAAGVKGLSPGASYSGEIIARDSAGNTQKTNFVFKTLKIDKSKLVHRYIEFQGYKRDFAYYLPSLFDSAKSCPLVINLHGANGNAWGEIGYTYFKTIADRENFILLMPQALLGTYSGETIYQWNAHYIFPWDDVALLSYLIDYMYTKYNIDLSKVYISGMSNGGFMTFFAARDLQYRIAAIAPISGLISSNVFANYKLNRAMPLCYMHGTADSIVRINGVPSAEMILNFWITNNNCQLSPQVTPMPDVSDSDNSTVILYQYESQMPDSEVLFYKIIGGGHSVPGNEPGANMDINAYEIIWSFFSRHSFPDHIEGNIVDLR